MAHAIANTPQLLEFCCTFMFGYHVKIELWVCHGTILLLDVQTDVGRLIAVKYMWTESVTPPFVLGDEMQNTVQEVWILVLEVHFS